MLAKTVLAVFGLCVFCVYLPYEVLTLVMLMMVVVVVVLHVVIIVAAAVAVGTRLGCR